MDRPLISFVMTCYNQERFVHEALLGASSQSYSPLEIIISDDCSKDRTFDIVREVADAYRGPHRLVLNRNPANLGIGGNLSKAMELCKGELMIMAGGDDISLPERASRMLEAWNDSARKATSLYSRYDVVDERGQPRGGLVGGAFPQGAARFVHQKSAPLRFARRREPSFCGCAQAVSLQLYSRFGPLRDKICYEDTALSFRTALAGGLFTFVNASLVRYRWHGANTTFGLQEARPQTAVSFRAVREKRRIELERFVEVYKGFAADAESALQQGLIDPCEYSRLRRRILRESKRFELRSSLLHRSWPGRLYAFTRLYCCSIRPRELLENLPYLLPTALYCRAVTARNRMVGSEAAV
jgi:glycosyltransferase involved in cell wall biosynthesis